MANLNDRISRQEAERTRLRDEAERLQDCEIKEDEMEQALTEFDPVWEAMTPKERFELLRLVIERIDFDGQAGEIEVAFRSEAATLLRTQSAETIKEESKP